MAHHSVLTVPPVTGRALRLVRPLVLLVFASCGSDVTAPKPASNPAALYWALTLDHHAITLSTASPYDTSRITATPRDPSGTPLSARAAVTYQSTDLAHVGISPDGVLQAVAPATGIQVVATLSLGNVTHVDTAVVNVTTVSPPPVLTTFSIHPVPPDSAIWDANALQPFLNLFGPKVLVARALDSAGNAIPGLAVDFRSSDSTIAAIAGQTGVLNGMRPGQVLIIASATAYGVTKADTLPFTITMPIVNLIQVAQSDTATNSTTIHFLISEATIRQGGTIVFEDFSAQPMSVVFDDSTQVAVDSLVCTRFHLWPCDAGNIPPFGGHLPTSFANEVADLSSRSFPIPGTYTFHTTLLGATGRIIVTPPPARGPAAATRTAVR